MRYLATLFSIAALVSVQPVFAAKPKNQPVDPALNACTESCKKDKDATAYEACMLRCQQARNAQKNEGIKK